VSRCKVELQSSKAVLFNWTVTAPRSITPAVREASRFYVTERQPLGLVFLSPQAHVGRAGRDLCGPYTTHGRDASMVMHEHWLRALQRCNATADTHNPALTVCLG
jgi:hypothetical protein